MPIHVVALIRERLGREHEECRGLRTSSGRHPARLVVHDIFAAHFRKGVVVAKVAHIIRFRAKRQVTHVRMDAVRADHKIEHTRSRPLEGYFNTVRRFFD